MPARKRIAIFIALACVLAGGWWLIMPHTGTNAQPQNKNKSGFATERGKPELPMPAPFDGSRAHEYLKQLCAIGPRISGSAGMKKQQELLEAHFKKLGGQVTFQRFTARQASQPNPVDLANMIVSWHPEQKRRVIICCHYDTRPLADQEPNPRRWTEPFVSANDGTAGAAWLMEMAHHIKSLPLNVGVDFVLFDAEEFIFDGPNPPNKDLYFLGSDHFAKEYRQKPPGHKYIAAVLLDMAAGKNAKFPIEGHSGTQAGTLVSEIWRTAEALGVPQFKPTWAQPILDDHLALNRVGIPAVDIIDFDYPHWHRLSDLPDQCSPETMAAVAKVLSVWMQRVR